MSVVASEVMSVDVGVHLRGGTPVRYTTFPDEVAGGPFVSVQLGGSGSDVSLIVTDPAALTALITVATAARSDLVALLDRAVVDRAVVDRAAAVA